MLLRLTYQTAYEALIGELAKVHLQPYDVIVEVDDTSVHGKVVRIWCGNDFETCLTWHTTSFELMAVTSEVRSEFARLGEACKEATVNSYKSMMKSAKP